MMLRRCLTLCLAVCTSLWISLGVAQSPQRVVAVDGAITEIIYALGAESMLVGVDSTSIFPAAARDLPSVGYRRTLTAEGLLALQPDLILATAESGPKATLEHLASVGVKIVTLPDVRRPDDVLQRVARIAAVLDRPQLGEQLQQKLQQQIAGLQRLLPVPDPKPVLFLLAAGTHGVMLAGQGTQAQMVLDVLQLPNAVTDVDSYKPFNAEAALALQPELIVVAETQPGAFSLASLPALQATPAAQHNRVLVLDSMYLLSGGPRWPTALRDVLQFARGTNGLARVD